MLPTAQAATWPGCVARVERVIPEDARLEARVNLPTESAWYRKPALGVRLGRQQVRSLDRTMLRLTRSIWLYVMTLLAVLGGGAFTARAAAESKPLPALVQASIDESTKACEPEPASLQPGFVTIKEINGDGRADYVLDYSKFQCGDNPIYFCGTAGCLMQIFASLPNGRYVKVLDRNVRSVRFTRIKGRAAMLLGLHGSECGEVSEAPCAVTLLWNGREFRPRN